MTRNITSLARAFRLLDAPERPARFPRAVLTRAGKLPEAQLGELDHRVGFAAPGEYRDLLAAYGPFHLRHDLPDDLDEAELLAPARAVEERAPLKAFLTQYAGWVPDSPHRLPLELPATSLLPMVRSVDSNAHPAWLFGTPDAEQLWLAHEKDGLEPFDGTVEEALIQQVANFARWDLRTGTWWPPELD